MAIFAPGALTAAISGNIGAVNFSHGPHGPYLRRRATRCASNTPAQLAHRALMPAARAAWADLDPMERKGWLQAAARVNHTNRLGLSSPIAGYQLFLRYFVQARHLGSAAPVLPPVAIAQAPVLGVIWVLSSVPVCEITVYAPNRTAPSNWQLFMARTCSDALNNSANLWRYVTTSTDFGASVDFSAALLAIFSPLRTGERWLSRVRTGGPAMMPSPFFTGSHVVAAPPP